MINNGKKEENNDKILKKNNQEKGWKKLYQSYLLNYKEYLRTINWPII